MTMTSSKLASTMACRREPGPPSWQVVTATIAACPGAGTAAAASRATRAITVRSPGPPGAGRGTRGVTRRLGSPGWSAKACSSGVGPAATRIGCERPGLYHRARGQARVPARALERPRPGPTGTLAVRAGGTAGPAEPLGPELLGELLGDR